MKNEPNKENDELDKEYVMLFIEIEKISNQLNKHSKLKVIEWTKKLSQVTQNKEWKKNRNLYTILLLDNLINDKLDEPFSKFPPEGPLPLLSKSIIKSTLSNKFYTINEEELNLNYEKSKVLSMKKFTSSNPLSQSTPLQRPLSISSSNRKRNVKDYIEEFEIIKLKKELNNLNYISSKLNQELKIKENTIIEKEKDNKLLAMKIRNLEGFAHQLLSNPKDRNLTKQINHWFNK